jgi:hypothetical protein
MDTDFGRRLAGWAVRAYELLLNRHDWAAGDQKDESNDEQEPRKKE